MINSYDFLKSVLNTITEHIVVINSHGDILFVNKAWTTFGNNNNCLITDDWKNINYLKECDKAANIGDNFGMQAAIGIRNVIQGKENSFYFEYPCHSLDNKRWFMMRVTPFTTQGSDCFVISHQNITERKLAEEKVLQASRIDGLTGIPNRGYFNEFLHQEWRRCLRLSVPISLALLDLDHFKALNDTYGHQVGDQCLTSIGTILKKYSKRPSDICARYGGEEFVLVYGSTNQQQATILTNALFNEIRALNIPNQNAPTFPTLTLSVGLATTVPTRKDSESDLIKLADNLLYVAKGNGRDQIAYSA